MNEASWYRVRQNDGIETQFEKKKEPPWAYYLQMSEQRIATDGGKERQRT